VAAYLLDMVQLNAPSAQFYQARQEIPLYGRPERLMVRRGLVEIRLLRPDGATPLLRLCPRDRWLLPVPLDNIIAIARLPTEIELTDAADNVTHTQCRMFAGDVAQMTGVHTETFAVAKLARLLLLYASAFEQARKCTTATLPLTTQELASALGIELRTVTRALGQFRDRGLVAREAQGVLKLKDLDGLRACA
jgi:hypothetical protein